jgi:hypothetical protein
MFVAGIPLEPNSLYRSSLTDPSSFAFSRPRLATEGDLEFFPYLGHRISDAKSQEDFLYVLKRDSIETLTYTQDNNDFAQIAKIIQGVNVGTEGRAWRMENDIAFITPDKRVTTIGRIKLHDQRPLTNNIAYPIKRAMDTFGVDESFGEEYRERAFIGVKSNPDNVNNDILIVRNKNYVAWEGIWFISATSVVAHNGKVYYGNAYVPDVYEMQVGVNKVKGNDTFPMDASWMSGYINKQGTGFYLNEVGCLSVEGYITAGTKINFDLYKDFAETSFQQLVIKGTDAQFLDGPPGFSILGGEPLGIEPLGASSVVGEPDEEGKIHFIAHLFFPVKQIEYIAVKVSSSGLAQSYEITALGLGLAPVAFEAQNRIQIT